MNAGIIGSASGYAYGAAAIIAPISMLWNHVSPIPLPPPIPAPFIARLVPWIFTAAIKPSNMCNPCGVPNIGIAANCGIILNTKAAFIVQSVKIIESMNACAMCPNLCVGIETSLWITIASYAPIIIPSAIDGPKMSPATKLITSLEN